MAAIVFRSADSSGGIQGPPFQLPAPTAAKTILLVEDDELVLGVTSQILESAGYCVLTARDGLEALAFIQASFACSPPRPIHMVITDLIMPRMDGLSLVRALLPRNIVRLIAVGGLVEAHSHRELKALQCPCLQKPYFSGELLQTVKTVFEKPFP